MAQETTKDTAPDSTLGKAQSMVKTDFSELHAAMRRLVDGDFIPSVSTAVISHGEVVDAFFYGDADRESKTPLNAEHLFRAYSNTKLVTSLAALLLWEEGRFDWDDPIEKFIPELGNRQVVRQGAKDISEVEKAKSSITIRQLMNHTSGLTYDLFDPTALVPAAYTKAAVRNPNKNLQAFVSGLADFPLCFHPGTRWEYSYATDVVGRLVEVISGQKFSEFLQARIFNPLGMNQTGFVIPAGQAEKLTTLYVGKDIQNPFSSGLVRLDNEAVSKSHLKSWPMESGGGGLATTLGDWVKLIQSLLSKTNSLLKPETLQLMCTNQLPDGMWLKFPGFPEMVGRGFGLGSSVCVQPNAFEPIDSVGECGWGGLAGTVWWINPRLHIAGVLMTQRYFGQGGLHTIEFKKEAYKALGYR